MPPLLQSLTSSIFAVRSMPLTPELISKAKVCLIDFLAAATAGANSPSAGAGLRFAHTWGDGTATLIGRNVTASPAGAAFFNGLIGHAEELDDSHSYVGGLHLAAVVMPAALALAEQRGATGQDFIKALACGYEAAGRIARCINTPHRNRGFHASGTIGPFGAAAAASSLLGHDRSRMQHALAIAASTAAGIFAFLDDGATVKHLHTGRAALDGLMAALLSDGGMIGPSRVLEAKEGFFHAYAGEYDPAPLARPLPAPELMHVYHKIHSCCGHAFPAVDAALRLREILQQQAEPSNPCLWLLERGVRLTYASYNAAALLTNPAPRTIQEARFSIPFILALALCDGRVARSSLTEERLADPVLQSLAKQVTVTECPSCSTAFPQVRSGILQFSHPALPLREICIAAPRGTPEHPLSPEEILGKFHDESKACYSPERQEQIIEAIAGLELCSDMRALTRLL